MEPIALIARQDLPTGGRSLKLSAFKALLAAHPTKPFRLILPDAQAIPVSFHVTEVAHIQKRFIDCGGKLHTTQACQLQVWLGSDTDHRLSAGKLAHVLEIARKVLPQEEDLDIEIEYEDAVISQYTVAGYSATDEAVTLQLAFKHTDCLAKESCCPVPAPVTESQTACCGVGCAC